MTDLSDPAHSRSVPVGMTRDCLDPWQYIEFRPNGEVGPCCVRIVGDLRQQSIEEILNGENANRLRADLLGGTPDQTCRSCGLRSNIAPEELREKVALLIAAIDSPEEFDGEAYLDANPALRKAGVDAREHFIKHGRFEGRKLHPDF